MNLQKIWFLLKAKFLFKMESIETHLLYLLLLIINLNFQINLIKVNLIKISLKLTL
jgi:hypothetical protein